MKIRLLITTGIASIVLCIAGITLADGVTKRVKFAKGKSSATLRGSVIRGDRDTYILRAKADQTMTVTISSLEDNAVFQIKGPGGDYLQYAGEADDAETFINSLPKNGDYKIIVGGTRGNATYKLTVSIR